MSQHSQIHKHLEYVLIATAFLHVYSTNFSGKKSPANISQEVWHICSLFLKRDAALWVDWHSFARLYSVIKIGGSVHRITRAFDFTRVGVQYCELLQEWAWYFYELKVSENATHRCYNRDIAC